MGATEGIFYPPGEDNLDTAVAANTAATPLTHARVTKIEKVGSGVVLTAEVSFRLLEPVTGAWNSVKLSTSLTPAQATKHYVGEVLPIEVRGVQ